MPGDSPGGALKKTRLHELKAYISFSPVTLYPLETLSNRRQPFKHADQRSKNLTVRWWSKGTGYQEDGHAY